MIKKKNKEGSSSSTQSSFFSAFQQQQPTTRLHSTQLESAAPPSFINAVHKYNTVINTSREQSSDSPPHTTRPSVCPTVQPSVRTTSSSFSHLHPPHPVLLNMPLILKT
ncbi:unnamed protein product [Anisakis simplex]|uniref:Ovule protein n=1 Tax=Anisakis simplex TaxID=6269 RepID=A0A0M3JWN5_ANISI|nr:unnamed protein product [Anisakis simplex]